MPSEDADRPGRFDRLADAVDKLTSKAQFFAFCLGLVVAWLAIYPLVGAEDPENWQLMINSPTTIITFLLVALAANVARRAWAALHAKLNAIAVALTVVLDDQDNGAEADELREAVGLEDKEST